MWGWLKKIWHYAVVKPLTTIINKTFEFTRKLLNYAVKQPIKKILDKPILRKIVTTGLAIATIPLFSFIFLNVGAPVALAAIVGCFGGLLVKLGFDNLTIRYDRYNERIYYETKFRTLSIKCNEEKAKKANLKLIKSSLEQKNSIVSTNNVALQERHGRQEREIKGLREKINTFERRHIEDAERMENLVAVCEEHGLCPEINNVRLRC